MNIAAIVAEYNPFHNGHAYHIATARNNGATHVVCIMSGNFTQRGDVAIMDKLSRTRCALAAGADLVLELPVVYALSGAGDFARGSIDTLIATGCVDTLHFGSECGVIDPLFETVTALRKLTLSGLIDTKSNTPAMARSAALAENGYEHLAKLLDSPNNLLGVEYLMMLEKRYSRITPYTVGRKGADHDSVLSAQHVCSATQLRKLLTCAPEEAAEFWPNTSQQMYQQCEQEGQAPITLKKLELAILSRLRMASPGYLKTIAGVSEGLENRLYEAIRHHHSFEDVCAAVKTKRYPLSRIRRILLCAAIGITGEDTAQNPAYIRVLGQNEKGNEVLKVMSRTARLPMILRAGDTNDLSPAGKRMFRLENAATDLYTMAYSPMGDCGTEYTHNIYRYTKGGL